MSGSIAFDNFRQRGTAAASGIRLMLLLSMLAILPLAGGPARAGAGGPAAAAAVASAGLGACSTSTGKVLYGCVADALDRASSSLTHEPEAQSALRTAASQVRAATSKAQALSAITACRSVFSRIAQQVKSAGQDSQGFNAMIGVLSQAARLIQSKG